MQENVLENQRRQIWIDFRINLSLKAVLAAVSHIITFIFTREQKKKGNSVTSICHESFVWEASDGQMETESLVQFNGNTREGSNIGRGRRRGRSQAERISPDEYSLVCKISWGKNQLVVFNLGYVMKCY